MTKEVIEKYIQFAIDNGFKIKQLDIIRYCLFSKTGAGYCELYIRFYYGKNNSKNTNIIELITSKEFIEAVARGLNKKINIKELPTQEQIEELCKTQALFIAGFGKETFEEFILEIIK